VNVKNDRDESQVASGRLFQVRGSATANDLSPNEVTATAVAVAVICDIT